ncbi:hypothetical protein ACE8FZ_24685 [Peribacillus frigoritolerans]|uniref:hypothetical protein n=1 Tax=Peribacillus frigoritolerans TaxID=450367 RepID=UPI0035D0FA40
MIQIDRTAVDAAIENMGGMFTATEKVLAEYEAEKKVLENRGEGLNKKIAELQEEHAATMIDRETVAKDSISDYIFLTQKMKQLDDEMTTVLSLEDQLKENFKLLQRKYIPIIQSTYGEDLTAKNEFDVKHAVDLMRYELLKAISDYASEVRKQQQPLLPLIGEFLDDEELMNNNRSFKRLFDFDSTYLSYLGDPSNTVLAKNHIHYAIGGSLHPDIRKPKKDVE